MIPALCWNEELEREWEAICSRGQAAKMDRSLRDWLAEGGNEAIKRRAAAIAREVGEKKEFLRRHAANWRKRLVPKGRMVG